MTEAIKNNAERLAESVWVKIFARFSMLLLLPVLGLVAYLGDYWLNDRVKSVVKVETVRMTTKIESLTARVLVLETSAQGWRKEREKFEENALVKLEAISAALNGMNVTIAALGAKIEAQQREIDRR